jgi:hypothetical protein
MHREKPRKAPHLPQNQRSERKGYPCIRDRLIIALKTDDERRRSPVPSHHSSTIISESERGFQTAVIQMAHHFGWRVHHVRAARTKNGWRTPIQGDPGFPDLVLAKADQPVIFAELKLRTRRLPSEQADWAGLLRSTCPPCEYYIWRPKDWAFIEQRLRTTRGERFHASPSRQTGVSDDAAPTATPCRRSR